MLHAHQALTQANTERHAGGSGQAIQVLLAVPHAVRAVARGASKVPEARKSFAAGVKQIIETDDVSRKEWKPGGRGTDVQ